MRTLLLETATEKSCLSLLDGKTIISVPLSNGPELSKNIALEIHKLLKTNNFKPEQILVGQGPGSYTGVRVGTSLAKALAFGWEIPLFTFCSMKIFTPHTDGSFAILIDARMGGIHLACGVVQNGALIQWTPPCLLTPTEVEEKTKEIPLLLSPHPHLIEKRISRVCIESSLNLLEIGLDLKPQDALR